MNIRNNGFTLIEILISVSILVVILGFGFSSYLGARNHQALRSQVDVLVVDIRETMSRAKAQEDGAQWGIRFENPTGVGNDYYDIWQGGSYATGTITKHVTLGTGIDFSEPADGTSTDIIFSKATGLPQASSTISFASTRSKDTGDITLGAFGTLTYLVDDHIDRPSPGVPTVVTETAETHGGQGINSGEARLNSTVTPNTSSPTNAWFIWYDSDPTVCNEAIGTSTSVTNIGSGYAPISHSTLISGLVRGTAYWYCAIAENPLGKVTGAVISFQTSVISGELYRQGLLRREVYLADQSHGQMIRVSDPYLLRGYHIWARPVVKLMKKSDTATLIVYYLSKPWFENIAYEMGAIDKGSYVGKAMMFVGAPISRSIAYIDYGIADIKRSNIARLLSK